MSIKKMLLIAGMALAAVAFAVPAMAQAQEHGLTDEGSFLEPGAEITATSTDLKTKTSLGTLECKKVTLHMLVTENTDEHVVVSPETDESEKVIPATTEECVTREVPLFGTVATTITDGTVGEFTVNTWGTAEAPSSFTADIGSLGTCHLEGNVHLQAAEVGGSTLNIGPSVLTEGPGNEGICPAEGTMTGHFTLETVDSTPITADFAATE